MAVKEIKPDPNEVVIKILEELLEEAKSGLIQGVAISGTRADCQTFNVFEAYWHPVALIGEVRLMERDIVDCCVGTRRQPAWEYCE